MAEDKELVSPDRFVALMNDELRQDPRYRDDMKFVNIGTGYDFVAPTLTIMENQALDKKVFDCVSLKYTIAR
jgi:hypothetical protein